MVPLLDAADLHLMTADLQEVFRCDIASLINRDSQMSPELTRVFGGIPAREVPRAHWLCGGENEVLAIGLICNEFGGSRYAAYRACLFVFGIRPLGSYRL